MVLWTEIPLIDRIMESPEFYANAKQQLTELIRQNYNHPSVVCWGIFNEITLQKGPPVTNLVSVLADLVAREDSTRPSTCAVAGEADQLCNWYSKLTSFNK
jgi:beta-galactosidase